MRYYVVADPHGHCSLMCQALREAGYEQYEGEKKLILLGDLLDRGPENADMQDLVYDMMQRGEVILVRGNHEDLLEDLVDNLDNYAELGLQYSHHYHNRTVHTVCDLARCSVGAMSATPLQIRARMRQTKYYKYVLDEMVDYYETPHYVFVHGWIPVMDLAPVGMRPDLVYYPEWRTADKEMWNHARWINGMDAAARGLLVPDKTVVCGHYRCSYGHAVLEGKGDETGPYADYSPYYGKGIIALDACTVLSHRVNVLVLDD